MLALVAGTGALPGVLLAGLAPPPLICALAGQPPDLPPELPRLTFRIETLGSFLADLRGRGVTRLCMAGAMRRPVIDPALIDAATRPLIARLSAALGQGDDGTLRALIALVEEAGIAVVAAHDLAAHLLPPPGIPTRAAPGAAARTEAALGEATVAAMGRADIGQACVIRNGQVIAREGPQGTDAMLAALAPADDPLAFAMDAAGDLIGLAADRASARPDRSARRGILFKAPKPGQDRRADLPVIGPGTAGRVAQAGLSGLVIEAGGVMVLDLPAVVRALDGAGLFLWVRPAGGGR